ncbi:hypothetical protein [Streptantibioticus ferralitis]|uniref:hypothetical protein n=1 Tax=Streptantibioticus ferralitis TaxID=236510 RepID=UPI0027E2D552|nr:hypothetical protein [Streptantibioticus ferralitis]
MHPSSSPTRRSNATSRSAERRGLTGAVRDATGGDPLPGALVVATGVRGEAIASGASGGDGGFGFSDLGAIHAPGVMEAFDAEFGGLPSAKRTSQAA